MSEDQKSLGLYSLSGILLGLGFVWSTLWFLGFLGVLLFIYSSLKSSSLKISIWGGGVSWFIKSLLALSWGWSIYPIDWFVFPLASSGLWAIILYWVSGAVFISVGGILVSAFIWFVSHSKYKPVFTILALPLVWVLAEYLSAYFFSIATIGPEGFYSAAFSYGQLGYLLAVNEIFLLAANLGGVYVLSFLSVTVGVILWLVLELCGGRIRTISFSTILMVLVFSGFVHLNTNSKDFENIKVAIVDTNFNHKILTSPEGLEYKKEAVGKAVDAALATGAKYVVLPEGSSFNDAKISADAAYRRFLFQSGDAPVILIDSGRAELTSTTTVLRATLYDSQSKKAWQVDKDYLVPQGEYLPYLFSGLFKVFGYKEMVMQLNEAFDYVPGPLLGQSNHPSYLPRVLFCFSSADPFGVSRLIVGEDTPVFIAHPISHAWFNGSRILSDQQDAMLKIQAVWNDVNIVSAGNMVEGALYTKEGKKIQPTKEFDGEGWSVSLVEW